MILWGAPAFPLLWSLSVNTQLRLCDSHNAYKPGYAAGWCPTANRFNLFHLKTTTEHTFIRWDPGTEKGPLGAEMTPWAETAILLGHIHPTAEKTQIL